MKRTYKDSVLAQFSVGENIMLVTRRFSNKRGFVYYLREIGKPATNDNEISTSQGLTLLNCLSK